MKNLTKIQQLKSVERELRNILTEFSENYSELITFDDKIKYLETTIIKMEECFAQAEELRSSSYWFQFRTILTGARIDLHKQSYINLNCELRLLKELGGD